VTLTVTSNEALQGDVPSIKVASVGVATSKVATNSWTATYQIASQALFTASADATDSAGNAATQKTATFQGDLTGPVMSYTLSGGVSLETSDVLFISVAGAESGEYTGDTNNTVTISAASLSVLTKLGGTVVGTATTLAASDFQSVDNISFVYGAADLAIGAYKLSVTGTDTAGNKGSAATLEFKVVAQSASSIAVNPGWTLISIPGTPQDKTIGSVLANTSITQVWSFNNETKIWEFARVTDGVWEGTLIQIVDGRSYFVRATTFQPIKVLIEQFSPQRIPPQYALAKGWNGVGYTPGGRETQVKAETYLSSLGSGGWGVIRWWNPTDQQYESAWPDDSCTLKFPSLSGSACSSTVAGDAAAVKAGQGYLVFATKDGTLAP
jgi:hypothetical protein